MLVTQNVDGLHAQAGTSAQRLLELHGTNAEVGCQSCGARAPADPSVQRFALDPCAAALRLRRIPQDRHDQFRPVPRL